MQEFLLGEGEGEGVVAPNFDSENTTVTFLSKLLLLETLSLSPKTNKSQPNSPPPCNVSHYHYNQFNTSFLSSPPLTVDMDFTRKGYTSGTSLSCAWLQMLYRYRQY